MSNATAEQIRNWWSQFVAQAPRMCRLFKQQEEWDLPQWMETNLQSIEPALMWEFGPAVECDGNRLVITPESRKDLRPLVREILKHAPKLPGWEFYEHRLPESFEQAEFTVRGRTGGEIDDVWFQADLGDFNRINLVFVCDRYQYDDADALGQMFVAAETLLGEETLDRWIGAIEVARVADDDLGPLNPLRDLSAVVEARIAVVRESLPPGPLCEIDLENGPWSLLELKPEEASDYPGQSDLFVAVTRFPELIQNATSDISFDSMRYSRCGERFCYLKIDGSQGLEETTFEDRGEIEEALNEQLRPTELGCVIGGGTGLRYSYIELALTDVDQAMVPIRKLLQAGNIPPRTWLLFHDADLQSKWLDVWEDAPAPPMPEFGG